MTPVLPPMTFLPAFRVAALVAALATTALASAPAESSPASAAESAPAALEPGRPGVLLTREEAIIRALRENQRIKVSSFGRGIARANVLAEYGRFDPAITFRREYSESEAPLPQPQQPELSRIDDYAVGLGGLTPWGALYEIGGSSRRQRGTANVFTDHYVSFGGISITQPLLRGFGLGANLANLRIAKADRGIADWEYRATVIDTITNVIFAYESLAEARQSLQIAQRSRELAAQLVRDNQSRNRIGTISDADVTQARARVANREETILIISRNVRDLENRLRTLIGEPVNLGPGTVALQLEPLEPAAAPSPDGAADLQQALELRPDYQAAKLGITRYRAAHAFARNQLLPRVDFVGSYGYNGLDRDFSASRARVQDRDHRAYSAGVVVSVPLTFAEGRGRARAAKLAVRQSEADLVRVEQDIAVAVASAIGQLETTARRVEATTRAYELAQQALDAEQKKFRAGTSSTFVVLQLQEQLAAVQSNQVRAIADQRRAVANYHRELGATLAAFNVTLE